MAPAFTGMTRVARSRAVHAALAAEFAGGMHALSLELRAPGEGG
jgi:BolA protein